jgi:hypothetical protein
MNQPGYRAFVVERRKEDADAIRIVVGFLMGVHL